MTHAVDDRAQMKAASINDLPDSAFAYIEPGGSKDEQGKTTPRSKRHFPIHDAAHARNALARASQSPFGDKAMPKIRAACRKFGIEVSEEKSRPDLGICVRSFDFELRGEPDGDGLTLHGYAAEFNSPTKIRDLKGEFEETILPGAFKRSLEARTPVLQWDHGKDPAVGTAPIGDIQDLREDDHGLLVRARLYDHPSTGRVRQAIKGKSVKGMSFRFGVPDDGEIWSTRDGLDRREIIAADVHELGPVVFPAYRDTTVSVRSLLATLDPDEYRALIRELAAEVRALDLTDLVGQPGARSSGGDEHGDGTSGDTPPPQPHLRQRLDDGALRARGILL
jgi:HK97 family phage prohead protease